jgi:hypothetical protein
MRAHDLVGSATSWATGIGSWTPTGAGQIRTFPVTWRLTDDDNAANRAAAVTLAWQARIA